MNKYNPKELNAAIKEAIRKGIKEEGMYNCLMFIPSNSCTLLGIYEQSNVYTSKSKTR